MQASLDPAKLMEDFFAGYEYLAAHDGSTGRVGAVGFCYGGGVCNALAVAYPELAASVPYYGRQASVEDVPAIEAPLQLHYAGLDERMNAGWPAYEAALKEHGKTYEGSSTKTSITASITTRRRATTRRRRARLVADAGVLRAAPDLRRLSDRASARARRRTPGASKSLRAPPDQSGS